MKVNSRADTGVATDFSVRGFVLLGGWIDPRPGDCPCSFIQS